MSIALNRSLIYPDSDGQPMADNTKQFRWIVLIKENLELLFANEPEVFVENSYRLLNSNNELKN